MRASVSWAVAALVLAAPAAASPVTFFDGFEGETAGGSILNYGSFANWSVVSGSVDLVRSGEFGITCRSGNYCVDLDGSTGQAGSLASRTFSFSAGDEVDVVLWLSGNQRRGPTDLVNTSFFFLGPVDLLGVQLLRGSSGYTLPEDLPGFNGGFGSPPVFASSDPFTPWGIRFRAGSDGSFFIRLVHWGSLAGPSEPSDNIGVILDDVSVTITPRAGAIPEPATWAMLIAGFGLVGSAVRRQRTRLVNA